MVSPDKPFDPSSFGGVTPTGGNKAKETSGKEQDSSINAHNAPNAGPVGPGGGFSSPEAAMRQSLQSKQLHSQVGNSSGAKIDRDPFKNLVAVPIEDQHMLKTNALTSARAEIMNEHEAEMLEHYHENGENPPMGKKEHMAALLAQSDKYKEQKALLNTLFQTQLNDPTKFLTNDIHEFQEIMQKENIVDLDVSKMPAFQSAMELDGIPLDQSSFEKAMADPSPTGQHYKEVFLKHADAEIAQYRKDYGKNS